MARTAARQQRQRMRRDRTRRRRSDTHVRMQQEQEEQQKEQKQKQKQEQSIRARRTRLSTSASETTSVRIAEAVLLVVLLFCSNSSSSRASTHARFAAAVDVERQRLRSRTASSVSDGLNGGSSSSSNDDGQPHMTANLRHCSMDGDFLELFHYHVCHEVGHEEWQKVHADPHEYFADKFQRPVDGADDDSSRHGLDNSNSNSNNDDVGQPQRLRATLASVDHNGNNNNNSRATLPQHDPSSLQGPCAARFFTQLLEELQESAQRLFHEEANLLTLQMGMCNKLHNDIQHNRRSHNSPEARKARTRWLQSHLDKMNADVSQQQTTRQHPTQRTPGTPSDQNKQRSS